MSARLAFLSAVLLAVTGVIEHYIAGDIDSRLARKEYLSDLKSVLEAGAKWAFGGAVAHACMCAGMCLCCCCEKHEDAKAASAFDFGQLCCAKHLV